MSLIQPDYSKPAPARPERAWPAEDWEHIELHKKVREAISSLPIYFRTETHIAGIRASDINALNSAIGATIEDQVVRTMNSIRHVWDAEEKYSQYYFERQSQTFPDVLLRQPGLAPIMGIELKGWYLLSLEAEPSYRFDATPAVCNLCDLIVLVPWALSNVISGTPIAFDPYIESARYAAEVRNWWWMYGKESDACRDIMQPDDVKPYPVKSKKINDVAVVDSGNNLGRLARAKIMDDYHGAMKRMELCGVMIDHWVAFFTAFQGKKTSEEIRKNILRLAAKIDTSPATETQAALKVILEQVEKLVGQ